MDSGYMFNAEIIETSDRVAVDKEGCLSFPGEFCAVNRNTEIVVKYIDLSNREVVRSYSGLAARILQHEIDHLQGVTMKDRELENGLST
jgi:peptide deformylase